MQFFYFAREDKQNERQIWSKWSQIIFTIRNGVTPSAMSDKWEEAENVRLCVYVHDLSVRCAC